MQGRVFVESIIHIPHELFLPAETAHYEGELDYPLLKAGPDIYTFSEPLLWRVDITNTGEAFLLQGEVEGTGTTSCARCGNPAEVDLFGELEGYYLISEEDADLEDAEGDEYELLPESHDIDLLPLVQAALLLDVPYDPLCKDDCLGLCLKCGANLNEEACTCSSDYIDPLSPFAALKDLKI